MILGAIFADCHSLQFSRELPAETPMVANYVERDLPEVGTAVFAQVIGAEPEDYPDHPVYDLGTIPWEPPDPATEPPAYYPNLHHSDQEPYAPRRTVLEKTMSHGRVLFVEPDLSGNGQTIRLDDSFNTVVADLGVVQCRAYAEHVGRISV